MKRFLVLFGLLAACGSGAAGVRLGQATMMVKDQPYQVAGFTIVNRGAAMAESDRGEYVHVALDVSQGSAHTHLELWDAPGGSASWHGYRFAASSDGFTWGKADAQIIVTRP